MSGSRGNRLADEMTRGDQVVVDAQFGKPRADSASRSSLPSGASNSTDMAANCFVKNAARCQDEAMLQVGLSWHSSSR
jgi:hypothetical protein